MYKGSIAESINTDAVVMIFYGACFASMRNWWISNEEVYDFEGRCYTNYLDLIASTKHSLDQNVVTDVNVNMLF